MASIFKQKNSRFWWIKYRDASTGKTIRKSTKLVEFVRARKLRDEFTGKEATITAHNPDETWDRWVLDAINLRYGEKKLRAECAWRNLKMFLNEHAITAPRQLLRTHSSLYLHWRERPNKSRGKYRAGLNTTLLEMKFMSIIMDEAIRKGFTNHNPWRALHIHRELGRQKPELPRTALARILLAIRQEPPHKKQFFLYSFLIARYHGCRLSETHLNPQTQVSISPTRAVISFNAKGGRPHTVLLHPKLLSRFQRLQAQGRTETYEPLRSPAKEWFNLLTRCGIKHDYPGACFHSLRVTAATMLARKGVSEKMAMSYLGHASTTVHRSYVRLKAEDLTACSDALS